MRPRLLVTRRLPPKTQQHFDITQHMEFESPIPKSHLLRDYEYLLCMLTDKIDSKVMESAPSLRLVSTMSVGYDHIDVQTAKERGIQVGNTPDVLTNATADLTLGLLLATTRRLVEATRAVQIKQWTTWNPVWMCGSQLSDKKVGIVGMGRIGQAVAKRLISFEVDQILYTSRTQKSLSFPAECTSLDELLQQSDIVIATCALNQETRHLFNKERFKMMKPTSTFINVSRGGVVNQPDLYQALKEGWIHNCGLDVTDPEPLLDDPLLTLDNCLILPHIGSATMETREAMASLALKNVHDHLLQMHQSTVSSGDQ
ncbi:D-isomer specific 2-hydroxyacid dehydrogenase [Gorgonomyces haynaldii]|nr:D-isomer specific 2-hydroxyacid dehydrogenase [Gorgonomyces haynaldii]